MSNDKDAQDYAYNLAWHIYESFCNNPEDVGWIKDIFDNNKVRMTYHVNHNLEFNGCCMMFTRDDINYTIDTWTCKIEADDHMECGEDEMTIDVADKINDYVKPMWEERLRLFLAGQVSRL